MRQNTVWNESEREDDFDWIEVKQLEIDHLHVSTLRRAAIQSFLLTKKKESIRPEEEEQKERNRAKRRGERYIHCLFSVA